MSIHRRCLEQCPAVTWGAFETVSSCASVNTSIMSCEPHSNCARIDFIPNIPNMETEAERSNDLPLVS